MVDQINLYTVEDFDHFIALPEDADRRFGFIDGEIITADGGSLLPGFRLSASEIFAD
ncbi:MAG: hypothetical protein L6Q98_12050 [Anaerolineae bacterium]|nr:hypothetical protein [Anaerolineae bacterium]NUQ05747.1 hypothetical protein [Anaerolineae bacterium]